MTLSAKTSSTAVATSTSAFWSRDVFDIIVGDCLLFVALTVVAMLVYPGATVIDHGSKGYRFFENFFSDLGQTRTLSGAVNFPSMLFFIVALVTVALGLGVFLLVFTQFFAASPLALWLSRGGAIAGAITTICFIGVAATPWNLVYPEHVAFVDWAFRSFLVAVICEIAALLVLERTAAPGLPRRFLWVFVGFAATLFAYILLLSYGPASTTPTGEMIQATGQKVIVYAAIATILLQAIQARWLASDARE